MFYANGQIGDGDVGDIKSISHDSIPYGWLYCDGREVSRTTYSALFAKIGTKYGNGDGINTFNVPDFRGRHLEGASADNAVGTHLEAGLPNITGEEGSWIDYCVYYGDYNFGAFYNGQNLGKKTSATRGTTDYSHTIYFNASKGETKTDGTLKTANEHHVYGASDTVQPDSVCVNYIIKY